MKTWYTGTEEDRRYWETEFGSPADVKATIKFSHITHDGRTIFSYWLECQGEEQLIEANSERTLTEIKRSIESYVVGNVSMIRYRLRNNLELDYEFREE